MSRLRAKGWRRTDLQDINNVSGDAGIDNRGKKRVHLNTGTEDHGRAAKILRSCNPVQGESSSSGKSFGSHLSQSFRDSAQPRSILKNHGEDRGVGHQVHHNLMSHSQSVASTAPDISASGNSTPIPQRQRRNTSGLDASLDTEDGKSLHVIATGMSDNQRLLRQQKGQNIAGHTFGKQKPQSSRRMVTIEHGRNESRPSGEATGAGSSQHWNRTNGNATGQNQTRDHQQQQNRSDGRPQPQSLQQQVSTERQEYDRRERRPSGEATGARTFQHRNGSNRNETGHNQSRYHQQHQNGSDRRLQQQSHQQQVTPSGEATGTGTSQRRRGSNRNETRQNQSRSYQKWRNRSYQRPQHQYCQQQVSFEIQERDRRERRSSCEATDARDSSTSEWFKWK